MAKATMREPDQWRRFFVPGVPATKGSKSIGRYGQVYEQSKKLRPWMDTVAQYTMVNRGRLQIDQPCGVQLDFYLGKRDLDLDKLMRAVWDALVEGGILVDDRWIVESQARKVVGVWEDRQGCEVYIYRVA
jgi:Holliday junction resolvase RusA-like endonuclease